MRRIRLVAGGIEVGTSTRPRAKVQPTSRAGVEEYIFGDATGRHIDQVDRREHGSVPTRTRRVCLTLPADDDVTACLRPFTTMRPLTVVTNHQSFFAPTPPRNC